METAYSKDNHLVVIGGGQAGLSAVAKLRELNGDVAITLISDEPVLPYQRPPLSKKYLSGEMPLDRLLLRPQSWFDEQQINTVLGNRVSAIQADSNSLVLQSGEKLNYDKLLLATGSAARQLPAAVGGGLNGVYSLRSTNHSDQLRDILIEGKRLVVIGGGYIGLEVSAIAVSMGLQVTIVEMVDRILQRVAAPETSDFFRNLHTDKGVKILEGVGLARLHERDGHVTGAELTNGDVLECDAVLAGIGIIPGTELAEEAGLTLENGIAVDEFCRTSHHDIYAAGDCAGFVYKGQRIRLESVPNAIHQAEVAAQNMLGDEQPYMATPWFWSDQYDVKLQIAGLNTGFDSTVVRPGKREGAQSIWYYRGEDLLAVDAMNDAPSFMMARRILEAGKSIPAHVASDPAVNLKDWV